MKTETNKKKKIKLNTVIDYICIICPFLVGLMGLQSIWGIRGEREGREEEVGDMSKLESGLFILK